MVNPFEGVPEWVVRAVVIFGALGVACVLISIAVGMAWIAAHLQWVP